MNTIFHVISKEDFINQLTYDDKSQLINAVKKDWNRINIYINKNKISDYHTYLTLIKRKYSDFLELMLLLSNQNVHYYPYKKLFDILSQINYTMVTNRKTNDSNIVTTDFNITPLIKQAIITNSYNIYCDTEKPPIYFVKIITIINLITNDSVIMKFEFLKKRDQNTIKI